MQSIEFLKHISNLSNPVFTIKDVSKITRKSDNYARLLIYRIVKKGLVKQIERGKYTLSDDAFGIGSNLIVPSYISFLSAYHIYGLTTQMPVTVQIICAISKKPLKIGSMEVRFTKFKKSNIFGYKRMQFRDKYVFLAEPEKAIVDSLYYPKNCPVSQTYQAIMSNNLNMNTLADYALLMSSSVTLKRLGYLLELRGFDIYGKVEDKINKKYDLLNPFLKKTKSMSAKWKLSVNEAL